eukprot:4289785-Lingulodinium_polyedra.AAC.1
MSLPEPAQNLTTPRLSPEHLAGPSGHSGRSRASRAAPAAKVSAVRASAPEGTARVVVSRRIHGAEAPARVH